MAVVVIVGVLLYLKSQKKETGKEQHPVKQNAVEYQTAATETNDTLEYLGFTANENFVVREGAEVRRTPNIAAYNTLYELKFGTKVYTKNIDKENKNNVAIDESLLEQETRNGFVAIYSVKPVTLSEKPVGYIFNEDIIEKSEFKNYKPKAPPLLIPEAISTVIENNLNIDGATYTFIRDTERFNNSLCYGDFNDDQTVDFAVALDRADQTASILLVYALHPSKNTYSLLYKKEQPLLFKIVTVPKNTVTTVNYEATSFPVDGIRITNIEQQAFFQVYDTRDKSFTVFRN